MLTASLWHQQYLQVSTRSNPDWGAQRNLEQGLPHLTDAAPEAASVLRGPTWWEQGDGGASSWASERSWRTEGTSDAEVKLTSGEASSLAGGASYNLLWSCLYLVGKKTTLHSQNHLCKTSGSAVTVFPLKSSSVHLTSDIYNRKMTNCTASRLFTYILFYSPPFPLLLFVYLTGQVYSGLLGWHFSFAVFA